MVTPVRNELGSSVLGPVDVVAAGGKELERKRRDDRAIFDCGELSIERFEIEFLCVGKVRRVVESSKVDERVWKDGMGLGDEFLEGSNG